jgi:hypothetical protein
VTAGDVVAYPGSDRRHRVEAVEDDRIRLVCGRLSRERTELHPRGVALATDAGRPCTACFPKET